VVCQQRILSGTQPKQSFRAITRAIAGPRRQFFKHDWCSNPNKCTSCRTNKGGYGSHFRFGCNLRPHLTRHLRPAHDVSALTLTRYARKLPVGFFRMCAERRPVVCQQRILSGTQPKQSFRRPLRARMDHVASFFNTIGAPIQINVRVVSYE
jgi:hypothetical protein